MNQKNSQLNKLFKKSDSSIVNEKFQDKLYTWFEDKGLLSELRAHLRQKMINALKETSFGVQSLNKRNSKSISPKLQAMNLLVADFLLNLQYHYTLSVFVMEVPMLSNLSEFSTYVSKLAEKNFEDSSGSEAPPRIHKKDVEDILQALGFAPDSHISIRTRRMYQFNRDYKALLTCLIECLQAANFASSFKLKSPEKLNDRAGNELWPKEIQDVFIDSDLSFEQLEILQEHVTRYYRNAVKKLKTEEESKYRLKVAEVLQKEKETYGKLAETEKRLREQQEIIEKEISMKEEQLKTLSAALRKQHEAIAERLLHLQKQSLKLSEKEEALKMEKEKEVEKLDAKKSELELKEKELDEAYVKLSEEQKKIADEKQTLELTQKLIGGANVLDCSKPQDSIQFLQHLSHQCSVLTQKLSTIRSEREEASVKNLCSSSQALSLVDNATMFEQHKELINETKATLEQKINELMMRLEETKEKHLVSEPEVPKNRDVCSHPDKNLISVTEEPDGFDSLGKVDSKHEKKPSSKENLPPNQLVEAEHFTTKNGGENAHGSQQVHPEIEGQSSSKIFTDENDNKITDVDSSRTALVHKLNVESHTVRKLQEENTELKSHALLLNQQIIDLTIQTRGLETRLSDANKTVRVVTVNPTDVSIPILPSCTTVSLVSPYSPIMASAAPFALARPRRQWFNRHIGSGEESTFSPLSVAPSTSGRARVRELRKKPLRRIPAPAVPNPSSTETSSGIDTLEETRKRLRKLEKESCAVNRMYQDYQSKKEQNSQVIFQEAQTGSTNTLPVYNNAESQNSHPTIVTSNFRPYTSFRPICSTLRPIITSVLPQSSYFSQNIALNESPKTNLSDSRQSSCAVMNKLTNKNTLSSNIDECDCFGETSSTYQKCQQHPNRKFRHYYRHWLDSHFRKTACASPTDSEASRISPLKQLFHLKQYKYKKYEAAALKNRSAHENDKDQCSKSLRTFHLSKNHSNKENPQLIILENDSEISQSNGQPLMARKKETFLTSSDEIDSMKFERLILQNQQNVTALKEKFENIQNFSSKVKCTESTAYFLDSHEKTLKSPRHAPDGKASNSKIGPNCTVNCGNYPKIYEIPSSLDIAKESPARSENQIKVNSSQEFDKNEIVLSRNTASSSVISETNLDAKTSGSKQSITDSEYSGAFKIKENYKRLSLYNRLNDYYEEIISEMNASEEENQDLSEIDQLLQPVVIDSENGLKDDDFNEHASEDLIKEPTQGITEFEPFPDPPGGLP